MGQRDNSKKKSVSSHSDASAYAEKTFDATRAALLEAERLLTQRANFTSTSTSSLSPSYQSTRSAHVAAPTNHVQNAQNAELVQQVIELRQRNLDLASASEMAREKETQVRRLRETEQLLNEEISSLTNELSAQRRESEERGAVLEDLQRSLETHRAEIEFLKQTSGRIVQISAKMGTEKDSEIEKLRAFEAQSNSQLQNLNEKCYEQAQSLREKSAAISELQNELKALGNELKTVQAELAATKEQGNRKLAGLLDENWAKDIELSRLSDGERELKSSFEKMEIEFKKTSVRLSEVSEELESVQNALLESRQERIRLSDTSEKTIQELREESETRLESLVFSKTENDHFRSQLESVTEALTGLQSAYRMQTTELEQAHRFLDQQMIVSAEDLKRHQTAAQTEIEKVQFARETDASRFAIVRSELESKITLLNSSIERTSEDFEISQELIADLEVKLKAQISQRIAAENQARNLAAELVDAKDTARFSEAKLQVELNASRKNEANLLRQIGDQRVEIEKAAVTAKALAEVRFQQGLQKGFDDGMAARQSEINICHDALRASEDKIAAREAVISSFETKIAGQAQQIASYGAQIAGLESLLQQADSELGKVNVELSKANGETERVAKELQETRSRVIELDKSLAEARTDMAHRSRELASAVDASIALKRANESALVAHRKELESAAKTHRSEIEAYATRETDYRDELAHLRTNCTELQAESKDLDATIERLESQLTDMRLAQIRFDQVQSKTEIDREQLDKWSHQLDGWNRQLESRELQLRRYANALTKEKTEALRFSKQIADEMKMARATHPLKDYLRLTEFELSKLEVQMKKTPMLSPDRPKLESALTQMIEQREFLKSVLGSTQRSLEHQANEFMKTIQSGRLAPVPPPPPRASMNVKPQRPTLQSEHGAQIGQTLPETHVELGVKWEGLDQELS